MILNYLWYICLALAFIGIAADEVLHEKIRSSKYGRAYSLALVVIATLSLVFYITAAIMGYREESTMLSTVFLIAFPIINLIGRGAERGSAKRETWYWVLIFVCAIAIGVKLFGF